MQCKGPKPKQMAAWSTAGRCGRPFSLGCANCSCSAGSPAVWCQHALNALLRSEVDCTRYRMPVLKRLLLTHSTGSGTHPGGAQDLLRQ